MRKHKYTTVRKISVYMLCWYYALKGGEGFAADWGVDVAHHGSGRRLRLQRHVHRLTELQIVQLETQQHTCTYENMIRTKLACYRACLVAFVS